MANASSWAKRKAGAGDSGSQAPKVKPAPDPSGSSGSSSSSVGSASSESYADEKFHLPADHQPFLLLPGWDAPPPPPPPPPGAGGSSSGSGSGSGSDEGGSESEESGSGGDSGSKPGLPVVPALPPPAGFACAHCAMFKALGNGNFGCESDDYQRWAGTDKLVETKSGRPVMNPERASSDWYSPANGPSAQPIPTRHTPK